MAASSASRPARSRARASSPRVTGARSRATRTTSSTAIPSPRSTTGSMRPKGRAGRTPSGRRCLTRPRPLPVCWDSQRIPRRPAGVRSGQTLCHAFQGCGADARTRRPDRGTTHQPRRDRAAPERRRAAVTGGAGLGDRPQQVDGVEPRGGARRPRAGARGARCRTAVARRAARDAGRAQPRNGRRGRGDQRRPPGRLPGGPHRRRAAGGGRARRPAPVLRRLRPCSGWRAGGGRARSGRTPTGCAWSAWAWRCPASSTSPPARCCGRRTWAGRGCRSPRSWPAGSTCTPSPSPSRTRPTSRPWRSSGAAQPRGSTACPRQRARSASAAAS